jgi:hypothetical protein
MGALLGALVLLATLVTVAVRSLPTVAAGDSSMRPQLNFSIQVKATFNPVTSFEIDTPYMGSFETRWDAGALWDDEAPAYELRPGD